jgi:RNA polymerase sigma-70 factor, ECF subfamily
MLEESMDQASRDSAAVAAVRGGDVERFRELVERYERRVFAVAWSRLGDAALAEEATQEAFIRGYRRLWLLGDGARFAAWITSIARHAAINLGLRRRRELNKRARWALEHAATPETTSEAPADPCTPEMLRQTLEELPVGHRECLVLFYLEGKSGAEAAAALGISEAAFRVRMHRARGLLREQLEVKLEASLRGLRPAKSLVPAVMAAVLVSSSAKAATAGGTLAAGVGAKVLSALGKTFIFSWLVPLIPLAGALPGAAFTSWVGRVERRNYREPDGFRAQMHRAYFRGAIWGTAILMVLVVVFAHYSSAAWGIKGWYLFLCALMVLLTLVSARSLTIARNRSQIGSFAYGAIITAGIVALSLGWLPQHLAQLPWLVATVLFIFMLKYRPVRMDYSLYLRASQGLLRPATCADSAAPASSLGRGELLAFARFLGSRWLVNNFRWDAEGLWLRLPQVKNSFLVNMSSLFMPPVTRSFSRVLLRPEGTVHAHCSSRDERALVWLGACQGGRTQELGTVVEATVGSAWREFRTGNLDLAERMLGELPESEVFLVPPARSRSTRWLQGFLGALVLLMVAAFTAQYWMPPRWSGLTPASLTETQVRTFLNDTTPSTNRHNFRPSSAGLALFTCLALPSTNLFNVEGLQAMRDEVAENGGFKALQSRPGRAGWAYGAPLARLAVAGGWISFTDLHIQPEDVAANLRANGASMFPPDKWDYFLTREQSWSWVNSERFPVLRIGHDGLTQLRILRAVNCVDLADREKLIRQIASVQVLSGTPAPGEPPIHDWRDVRGLFFTPSYPALVDTYYSLAALEILGGLDKIDREQCIRGILRHHRGQGYFTSPESGGRNEYKIEGDARDTFAAFESLRILNALNRVKDLDRWQFRPHRRGVAKAKVTWNDVEAWVCQQRLARILQERKENPQAPVRSLLQE